jgi:hypothetical protein
MDAPDAPPPPTPFERAEQQATARTRRVRRRRRTVALLGVLLVGAVSAGAWLALGGPRGGGGPTGATAPTRDEALLQLFVDVQRSEGVMLGYYEQLEAELSDPAMAPEAALAIIATAAAEAVDGLQDVRASIVPLAGDAVVDDVRAAYLPHLDSWLDYLEAVAGDPELELDPDRSRATPFTLLINATARAFRTATEELLATAPSEEVRRLAEEILDEGFRGFDEEAQT